MLFVSAWWPALDHPYHVHNWVHDKGGPKQGQLRTCMQALN